MAGSQPSSTAIKRPRGRPSRASLLSLSNGTGDESASTSVMNTPAESLDGYDTPATTISPPAEEQIGVPKRGTIEVRLPSRTSKAFEQERSLRDSPYALKSRRSSKRFEILDSDDDALDDDDDRSAQVARQLQQEEYARDVSPAPSYRRSSRATGSLKTPSTDEQPSKRARASTQSSIQAPPSKKPRTSSLAQVSSSEGGTAGVDMDAEIAAHIAGEMMTDSNSSALSDHLSVADSMSIASEPEDIESEDEPLLRGRRRGAKPSRVGRGISQPAQPAARATRSRPGDSETLSLDEGDLLTEPEDEFLDDSADPDASESANVSSDSEAPADGGVTQASRGRRAFRRTGNKKREQRERARLETHHPIINTMWTDLEQMPVLKAGKAAQPQSISRQLKPFQLEGLAWMKEMEKTEWKGGLLGDEMGLGKTIQAVSLIMSDYPAKQPSLVLVPPVALMQWQSEIKAYTDGTLKTFVFHGTNQKTKGMTVKDLKKYDVIMMSYNSLESMYRKQEKGFKRKEGLHLEQSVIHAIRFHRVILDEAHSIKTRTTMTAKACFALQTDYRWCLSGTPLQNRIGEFFSLIRFLNISPFAQYLCKQCPCATLEWTMNEDSRCNKCNHAGMQHVSVFNQELLNPIQKYGNSGAGSVAFKKLRLMTDRIMLRRLKKDHTNAMELPVKEIYVDRQFFGEEENDFANSIMTNGQRKFDTYVAQGVLLNNYANIFGLIMQMRQVADHPDLLLKKHAEGGQNVLVCCICDEPSEDTIRSRCKHDFCRACVGSYVRSTDEPDCPRCHIPLVIDLEQPEIEQDESLMKKTSIINRIKMENWTSSSKIELLVHELHKLRSNNASHKSIIFSQFTTMLQLIEWRLRRAGITTVMLDGSMTPAQRQASIEHFMTNVDTECFLVSLKAGGVALNLTEASRVFIVDP